MADKPIFHYIGFRVWPNRVEFTRGCLAFKRTQTIPIRKITTVDCNVMTNKLTIITDDGKRHRFTVMNVAKARDAILENL